MTQVANRSYTYEEYLALEEVATEKHEYYQGEIVTMSGGSHPHNVVAMNISAFLHSALRAHPCFVYASDMRVRIEAADYSGYGDAMVICGEVEFYKERTDVVTNPLLIAEVLSPSTRSFDRFAKFEFYRYLPSFEHYLIVDPERAYVEYHQKTGDYWLSRYFNQIEQVVNLQLPHGEVALLLSLIYEKVQVASNVPPKNFSKKTKKPK
jgi:Uma2 family endonuclease